MVLFSSPQDFMDDEDDKESTAAAVVKESKDDNASKVPIDLPSPILLSSSMILAIASTGKIKTMPRFILIKLVHLREIFCIS